MARFTRSNVAIRNVLPGTPVAPAPTVLSDTFNRANTTDIVGSLTNSALGGLQKRWEGFGGGLAIKSNRAVPSGSTSSWAAGVRVDSPDLHASVTITEAVSAGSLYMDVRRENLNPGATPGSYRVQFFETTFVVTYRSENGAARLIDHTPYRPGSRVGLKVQGPTISLYVDNVLMSQITDTAVSNAGYAGLAGTASTAGFALDDFVITAA